MNKNLRNIIIYFLILSAFAWILTSSVSGQVNKPAIELETGEFTSIAKEGRIHSAVYKINDASIKGQYWESDEAKEKGEKLIEEQEAKQEEKDEIVKAARSGDRAAVSKLYGSMKPGELLSYAFSGELSAPKETPEGLVAYTSAWAGDDSFTEFANRYLSGKYSIDNSGPSIWVTLLTTFVPTLLIIGVMFFFLRQMSGGNQNVMGFGKAKTKRSSGTDQEVTFKDVAGIDEAIEELEEIKDFLANPGRYQKLGAKIPKGVLLVGPPGTGKTLLARAVAGEAKVPFFTISGSDFVEMFVGVGASRVRDLFEQAKAESPSIIFVDEIDAVGRRRGAGLGGGHDEREQTLNQLLVEMDGFDVKDNVIMIAATNRPDILDPALLRPGRFDRQIVVDRPDLKGREQILKIHSANKPMLDEIDLSVLARRTPGFTGADLANLVNEAALLAARRNKKVIGMSELEEGIDRVIAGPERKSRLMTDKEKSIIAYHEAGHAIVGHLLPDSDPVHKVTIIPRGRSLGSTWSLPTEDTFLESKKGMLDDIAVLLAGRAAEELTFGDITTGASNDIERASKTAKAMVMRFGMSEELGPQAFGHEDQEVFLGRDFSNNADYSNETAQRIDAEISAIISQAFNRAKEMLVENKDTLDLMVEVLLDRETLEGDALNAIFDGTWEEFLAKEIAEDPKAKEIMDNAEAKASADTTSSKVEDSSQAARDDTDSESAE